VLGRTAGFALLTTALFDLSVARGAEETPVPSYADSKVERRARSEGYQPVEVEGLDPGYVVVERKRDRVYLARVTWDGRRLQSVQRLGSWPAIEHRGVRVLTSTTGRAWVALTSREDAPDEVVDRVLIFALEAERLRRVGDHQMTLPKRRTGRSDVRFGDADPDWTLSVQGDALELDWIRGPRVLRVPTPDRDRQVSFTVGAEVTTVRWAGTPTVEAIREGYRDFLPPRSLRSAEVRAQGPPVEMPDAIDGRTSTAWRLPSQPQWGETELTAQLSQTETVQMIRVVPGCAADAESWSAHDELGRFRISLGGGLEIEIDRRDPRRAIPGVRAWSEFPLTPTFGRQLLIFLDAKRRIGWARFTPLAPMSSRSRGVRSPCLAEISFH